ncbi:replication initiator [Mycobacterium syngnathidarum]
MSAITSAAGRPVLGNPAIVLPGVPATIDPQPVIDQMVRRAGSAGFQTWWRRAESVGMCAHPIQLTGTDAFGRQRVVWTRCNNRRASVCPSCSDLYARDTWQLVHAGTAGGHHHMPAEVAQRPQVFTTLTAPSFGAVHSSTTGVCRDHRRVGGYTRCCHGKPLWCSHIHERSAPFVGEPLCRDCYDYLGHVQFSWHLPELWRRFTITLRRALARTLKARGHQPGSVRVSFVKVTEMQARAIPHIHALIRLDPTEGPDHTSTDEAAPAPEHATGSSDPNHHGPAAACGGGEPRPSDWDGWESPITAAELAALIQQAARAVSVTVPAAGADPACTADDTDDGDASTALRVRFGTQIDTQPLSTDHTGPHGDSAANRQASARLSPRRVARYLAKYVTKSLQDFGITARRLSSEAIADLDVSEHVRTILTTIAALADAGMVGIGRWLHTLGYRGHITTKSRRYSTTMGALRAGRAAWTREQIDNHAQVHDDPSPSVATSTDVMGWEFDRAGHPCLGDRTLIISAALRAIAGRRLARECLRSTLDARNPRGVPDG